MELTEAFTPYDGQPRARMLALDWDFYTGTPDPYEQPGQIVARARRFMARMCVEYPGQHVVAVTHGDVVTFSLLWALGRPPSHAHKGEVAELGIAGGYPAPASISSFTFEAGTSIRTHKAPLPTAAGPQFTGQEEGRAPGARSCSPPPRAWRGRGPGSLSGQVGCRPADAQFV
jgi:hypothetical protein